MQEDTACTIACSLLIASSMFFYGCLISITAEGNDFSYTRGLLSTGSLSLSPCTDPIQSERRMPFTFHMYHCVRRVASYTMHVLPVGVRWHSLSGVQTCKTILQLVYPPGHVASMAQSVIRPHPVKAACGITTCVEAPITPLFSALARSG